MGDVQNQKEFWSALKTWKGGPQGHHFGESPPSTVQQRDCPRPMVSLAQEATPSLYGSFFVSIACSLSSL